VLLAIDATEAANAGGVVARPCSGEPRNLKIID